MVKQINSHDGKQDKRVISVKLPHCSIVMGTLFLLGMILAVNAQVVTGKVVDALSARPLQGVAIQIPQLKKSYTTNESGQYTTDVLEKGTFGIKAEFAQYLTQSKTVVLASANQVGTDHITADFSLYNIASNTEETSGKTLVKYFFPGHNVVEISISDESNKLVRKVFDRTRKGGAREFAWDGKNNDGKDVAPGNFTCKILSGNLITIQKIAIKDEKTKNIVPKVEPAKVEQPKQEPAKVDAPKAAEASKPDAVIKVEPLKADTVKAEPAKIEPAKIDSSKTTVPKAEPVKTETPKTIAPQVVPAKADASKTVSGKPDTTKTNAAVAPAKTESPKAAAPKTDTLKAAPKVK